MATSDAMVGVGERAAPTAGALAHCTMRPQQPGASATPLEDLLARFSIAID